MPKITARQELYDHLKYLVGHEDANKMIDEYKEEILSKTIFYEVRNKTIKQLKEKIISEIYTLSPYCYNEIQIYNSQTHTSDYQSRPMVDRVDMINMIKNICDENINKIIDGYKEEILNENNELTLILPCKLGNPVWKVYAYDCGNTPCMDSCEYCEYAYWKKEKVPFSTDHISNYGKTIFLSEEEADLFIKSKKELRD